MRRIYPTSHARYAARFITDDFAVEYHYSLGKGIFQGRIYGREGDGRERRLSQWDTAIRSLDGADAELARNAENAIETWRLAQRQADEREREHRRAAGDDEAIARMAVALRAGRGRI